MSLLRRTLLLSAPLALLASCVDQDAINEEFLAAAAAEPGAVVTDSGLVYLEVTAGAGAQPLLSSDTVNVTYEGRLIDGEVFDSGTHEFRLNQVIPCWTEGVMRMMEGGESKLTCPPNLAYGARGTGPIPGNSVLVFDVTLIDVVGR